MSCEVLRRERSCSAQSAAPRSQRGRIFAWNVTLPFGHPLKKIRQPQKSPPPVQSPTRILLWKLRILPPLPSLPLILTSFEASGCLTAAGRTFSHRDVSKIATNRTCLIIGRVRTWDQHGTASMKQIGRDAETPSRALTHPVLASTSPGLPPLPTSKGIYHPKTRACRKKSSSSSWGLYSWVDYFCTRWWSKAPSPVIFQPTGARLPHHNLKRH